VAEKLRERLVSGPVQREHPDVLGWMRTVEPRIVDVLLRDVDERIYDRVAMRYLADDMVQNRRVGEAFQSILMLELWREYMGLRGTLMT
jgi:hypothetical protein